MDFSSKGQVGAITVVLLTGITIGAASVVYVWGEPILNKRESQSQLDAVESKVLQLRNEIVRVSESGEGTSASVDMNVDSSDYNIQILKFNETSDYIDIVVEGGDSPYADGQWTLLKGENPQNLSIASGDYAIKGEDKASVLMVKPQSSVITYRIEFRNMYSQSSDPALTKTDLISSGSTISDGSSEVSIRNIGAQIDSGSDGLTISNGQTLSRERTEVNVDLG